MRVINYINLTNGIEFLEDGAHGEDFRFIRIQSTACEQKRWDSILLDLDNDFLLNLAIGNCCYVIDYGKRGTPRAIWQGLAFIRYAINKVWFNRASLCDKGMHTYFEQAFKKLHKTTRSKLKYYRKFLGSNTEISLSTITGDTKNDGRYEYFKDILLETTRRQNEK